MLIQNDYQTHNHVKFLLNYHFVFIPKRRKKVLKDEIATRTRQIFAALAIEKGWDILALEVAPDHVHLLSQSNQQTHLSKLDDRPLNAFTTR